MTPGPPPRHLVAILLFVAPLSQIPLDIYTPALPQMVIDLGSTSAAMQNTVTAYMLGMSIAFVPVGVVADALGRKRVLLSCLAVVVLTSLLCAVAGNVPFLLAVRFVQGAAASACLVLAMAIAADSFRGDRLTSVSGLLGVAWGLAPVLAPAVGGVLVQFCRLAVGVRPDRGAECGGGRGGRRGVAGNAYRAASLTGTCRRDPERRHGGAAQPRLRVFRAGVRLDGLGAADLRRGRTVPLPGWPWLRARGLRFGGVDRGDGQSRRRACVRRACDRGCPRVRWRWAHLPCSLPGRRCWWFPRR